MRPVAAIRPVAEGALKAWRARRAWPVPVHLQLRLLALKLGFQEKVGLDPEDADLKPRGNGPGVALAHVEQHIVCLLLCGLGQLAHVVPKVEERAANCQPAEAVEKALVDLVLVIPHKVDLQGVPECGPVPRKLLRRDGFVILPKVLQHPLGQLNLSRLHNIICRHVPVVHVNVAGLRLHRPLDAALDRALVRDWRRVEEHPAPREEE
mmetsp:Transcript_48658/g.139046  ORF Transcript_48658/g.139046 Transcript_48658/m.139046 type:complete len:208 (+) Transcript_48658:303-926(+)